MRLILVLFLGVLSLIGYGQFAPAANVVGTTAIHKDSSIIKSWAVSVEYFNRGYEDISLAGPLASFGDSTAALGYAEGTSTEVVSLGDKGEIVLRFEYPIKNDLGPDFAVFENSFNHDYLEFAHVEVSTDGLRFVRIPSESAVQTISQTGGFGSTLAEWTHNLAGKYIQGYGTPFDLEDIVDSAGVNLDSINYVKIIDVVGSINPVYGTFDSQGNIINEPYPSAFASGGFDLDAVAVINENNIYASFVSSAQSLIYVYPNPSAGMLQIANYSGEYSLYSMRGQKLVEGFYNADEKIDLTNLHLNSGIYLLKLEFHQFRILID